jgi:hypothetical protein
MSDLLGQGRTKRRRLRLVSPPRVKVGRGGESQAGSANSGPLLLSYIILNGSRYDLMRIFLSSLGTPGMDAQSSP